MLIARRPTNRCTSEIALSPRARLTCALEQGHAGDHRTMNGTRWTTPSTVPARVAGLSPHPRPAEGGAR